MDEKCTVKKDCLKKIDENRKITLNDIKLFGFLDFDSLENQSKWSLIVDTTHFVWNVDRMLLPIYGEFGIRWYSLLFAGGIVIGYLMVKSMFRAEGRALESLEALPTYVILGTIIGARLGHCLFYEPEIYLKDPLRILYVHEGGLASHGGFLGVFIALMLYCRQYKNIPIFWLLDRIAMPAMIAAACIRFGNFFNSEIVGLPSNVPWAVIFAKNDSIPRHPSQLYEAIGYLWIGIVFYILYLKQNRKIAEGRWFGLIMIVGWSYRALMERFKENQVAFESAMSFNMGQLLSIPFLLVGLACALLWHHKIPFFRKFIEHPEN